MKQIYRRVPIVRPTGALAVVERRSWSARDNTVRVGSQRTPRPTIVGSRANPRGLHSAATLTRVQVHAALDGDRAALAELVRTLLPVIKVEVGVALVRRALPRRRDARQEVDDFSHDVLLHLLSARGKLLRMWDPDRGRSLASFVRLITRQRVARILLGHRGNPWSEDPTDDEVLAPLTRVAHDDRALESREELRALLERLRAHLSERGLALFHGIYVEQRSIAEVAAEHGMTREAVDAWNTRTRNLARRLSADRAEQGSR
jgi:RNA polymerase sigma factor (sigma-70 family)